MPPLWALHSHPRLCSILLYRCSSSHLGFIYWRLQLLVQINGPPFIPISAAFLCLAATCSRDSTCRIPSSYHTSSSLGTSPLGVERIPLGLPLFLSATHRLEDALSIRQPQPSCISKIKRGQQKPKEWDAHLTKTGPGINTLNYLSQLNIGCLDISS